MKTQCTSERSSHFADRDADALCTSADTSADTAADTAATATNFNTTVINSPFWSLDHANWPFSVASASLLFRQWAQATFMSVVCSLPLQTKRLAIDQLQDPELFR